MCANFTDLLWGSVVLFHFSLSEFPGLKSTLKNNRSYIELSAYQYDIKWEIYTQRTENTHTKINNNVFKCFFRSFFYGKFALPTWIYKRFVCVCCSLYGAWKWMQGLLVTWFEAKYKFHIILTLFPIDSIPFSIDLTQYITKRKATCNSSF